MKFAGPFLSVLMALVVSSIITHGVMPRAMTESVIIPVIKNKNKRVNDKGNYRSICLSNICSKIVEISLARRLNGHLHSTHNQFGFIELTPPYLRFLRQKTTLHIPPISK